MNQYNIGEGLKKARLDAKITVKQISDQLIAKGFKASPNTIYSWENNNSQPSPDALLYLCKQYGIPNPLNYFDIKLASQASYVNDVYNNLKQKLSNEESAMIEKYRLLSPAGQKVIDNNVGILFEYERSLHESSKAMQLDTLPDNVIDMPKRYLAHYDVRPSAGMGNWLEDSPYTVKEVGPEVPIQTSYLLTAKGDSMEPLIHDDELLYIKKQDFVESGEIGIFIYDQQVYVKQYRLRGQDGYLVSLNKKYDSIHIQHRCYCLGKVLNK